jgi:uncharacterized protein (TIGR03437 family)
VGVDVLGLGAGFLGKRAGFWRAPACALAGLALVAVGNAAPMLRLVASTVGPVSLAAGATTTQTVEAYNAGDGALTPLLRSSVSWIGASAGAPRACSSRPGLCIPLLFTLSSAGLPAGNSTGIVTVTGSDPNTIDAPQTITVTLAIGGAVPASVDSYVAPGGTRDIAFATNNRILGAAATQDGGKWLSLLLDANGSFQFSFPYRIHIAPQAAMPLGTYSGAVVTSGSGFAADNKTIPVTMRVTNQPIALVPADHFHSRLAQGAPPFSGTIPLTNLGLGTLTVPTVTASGGVWLTATAYPGGAAITLDAGTLDPGVYSGSVVMNSNAVNGAVTVPVDFEVIAKGPPAINFQGVLDNGTFVPGDSLSPGDIAVVKGEQLSFAPITLGQAAPLANQVGGAQVMVNGAPAPMYYSTYGQLAFQVPYETGVGTALVQVQRDGVAGNTVSVQVASRAPRLLLINVGGYGAILNTDGSIPMPAGSIPGVNTHPAQVGDSLTLYAIGLGPTTPAVGTGQPAPSSEPLARLTTTPVVNVGGGIGGTLVTPLFAGLSPTYAGLYQVNFTIPSNVAHGTVNLSLGFPDSVSNSVQIAIQ